MDGLFHSLPLSCAIRHSGGYPGCVACFQVFLLLALMLMLFSHTLVPARYALRDYCRFHSDQYELGGVVSGVGAWRLPCA